MPRPVDPQRHRERRLHIVDAALSVIAADGYAGATTAAICRAAGIGSGTFFHYFPTKDALLVGILETGTAETTSFFEARQHDPLRVINDYVDKAVADLRDPRAAGFITAVTGLTGNPEVAKALANDEQAVRDGLLPCVRTAQEAGDIRDDMDAARIVEWIVLLLDGFSGRVATSAEFDVAAEAATLREQVTLLLRPPAQGGSPGPR